MKEEHTGESRMLEATLHPEVAGQQKARQVLEENANHFRALIETTSDWIWEVDAEGTYLYSSPTVQDFLGFTPEEMVGKKFLDFLAPEDCARVRSAFEAAVKLGQPIHALENTNLHKNGRRVVLETSGVPVFDANGRVCRFRGIDRDITQRKHSEDALRASEESFRRVFEAGPLAMVLIGGDFRFSRVNDAFSRMLGYTPQELTGLSFTDVTYPPDIEKDVDFWQNLVQWKSPAFRTEKRCVRKNGEIIWTESSASVIRDGQGQPLYTLVAFADITERKRAESLARGMTEALGRILNALTVTDEFDTFLGLVVTAVAEQLHAHRACLWFHDKGRDELTLQKVYYVNKISSAGELDYSAASRPVEAKEVPLWQELTRTRKPIMVDNIARDPRVVSRVFHLSKNMNSLLMVPLLANQEVLGFLNIMNLTPRHYLPEELELASGLAQQTTLAVQLAQLIHKVRMAAVVEERNRMAREIHDTLAQGFAGILVQLEAAEDVLPAQNRAARAHLDRARGLAKECLAEARRSVWALLPKALEASNLPAALLRLTQELAVGGSDLVQFSVHGKTRPLAAEIESNLLRIGQEAITNALRHSQATRISAKLAFEEQQVQLTVEDNGSGFVPETKSPGEGFGLFGMQERAKRIGGVLTISSEPGRGTKVAVVLPVQGQPDVGVNHERNEIGKRRFTRRQDRKNPDHAAQRGT
ncbi:MAG TPA: PAS domain S-box protein [Terriglobia bacterium]|nr:PAS domain S-box protein [Terriglobia bacterium]